MKTRRLSLSRFQFVLGGGGGGRNLRVILVRVCGPDIKIPTPIIDIIFEKKKRLNNILLRPPGGGGGGGVSVLL